MLAKAVVETNELPAELAYARLRLALESFARTPAELEPAQLAKVDNLVRREVAIQARILSAPEASSVVIADETLQQAVEGIAAKYESVDDFHADLKRNDLDPLMLEEALRRELLVEAATEKLLASVEPPSDDEVEIYYLQQVEKFRLPETREIRHILLTVNDEFAENSREQALRRLQALELECGQDAERFAELAMQHSECPTAMHGGLLGRIKPGQLFPKLDEAAFTLEEGGFSGVLESSMGFHLLYCERCHPPQEKSLDEVREQLREHLHERKRRLWLRKWLSEVLA